MDTLDSMRTFMRVVELGSLAAVAQQMNVARSLITRQVAALEAQLGVKLHRRSRHRRRCGTPYPPRLSAAGPRHPRTASGQSLRAAAGTDVDRPPR
ncbi:MAG: LysR family transcriptional regulator [Candidatus Accumulibacter sp.]|nr:LysR family transcriptional regulator [Accumulibacter sp.]